MHTSVKNVSPASETLLGAFELAQHIRIDDLDAEAEYLNTLIDGATDYIQSATGQQLILATVIHTRDTFPRCREIILPLPPLQSVESVTYLDPNGNTVTLDPEIYTVDTVSMPGRILIKAGHSWPATAHEGNAVTINLTAGYSEGEAPPALVAGVRMLAAGWFENREAVNEGAINEVPLAVSSIINLNRFVGVV